jgi:hypothetical protein
MGVRLDAPRRGDSEGGGSWGLIRGREKGRVGHGGGRHGPAERNSTLFDLFKNISNGIKSIQSKNDISLLRKFQIKYGFTGK